MSNIDTALSQVEQCKQDIKQALINKGIDMTGVPFTEYASKVLECGKGAFGTFTGSNNQAHTITLGFKPTYIIITSSRIDTVIYYSVYQGGSYTDYWGKSSGTGQTQETALTPTDTGFTYTSKNSGGTATYYYIAIDDSNTTSGG